MSDPAYPRPDASSDEWIAWYRWKISDMDRMLQGAYRENAELRAALEQIAEWGRAYPLQAFPEPDFTKARTLLEAGGITLDAVSASCMRHVVTEVAEMARRALEQKP